MTETKKKRSSIIIVSLIIVLLVVLGVYFMSGNTDTDAEKNALSLKTAAKHMLLPAGETPVFYNIVDAETLIAQYPFYAGAQNGDQVIIFPNKGQAVIVSPERDILVNVGPITIAIPSPQNASIQQSSTQ